jgi:hypothetical protein
MRNDWLHVMWFVEGSLLSYRMPVKFRERRLCNGFDLYFPPFFLNYILLYYIIIADKPMLFCGHCFAPTLLVFLSSELCRHKFPVLFLTHDPLGSSGTITFRTGCNSRLLHRAEVTRDLV